MPKFNLIPQIAYPGSIKNIIFDFGGVICNIDIRLSEKKFRELGFKGFNPSYPLQENEDIFRKLEGGKIRIPEFCSALKRHLDPGVTDHQIIEAWNAMILSIPEKRVRLLEKLRQEYRIFILSNSNEIHYKKYLDDFCRIYHYNSFDELFEKAWFSFIIHLQKPSKEIFDFILSDGHLSPKETLFVDDSVQNIETARNAGLYVWHLQPTEDMTKLFTLKKT